MAQIFHFLYSKQTLGFFDKQAVILEELQDFYNMLEMSFPVL